MNAGPRRRFKRLRAILGTLAVLAVAGIIASESSPWPSALVLRHVMDFGGERMSAALEKHVPAGVVSRLDIRYDANDASSFLDVHYPAAVDNTDRLLPAIVWVHGGGWLSGSKSHIANYARILASHGYVVVGVDYPLAPGAPYPAGIRQVSAALAHVVQNAKRFHVDTSRLILAGDSAGAQLAAQAAIVVGAPSYAKQVGIAPPIERRQLIGIILHCGLFDLRLVQRTGLLGWASRTVGWSYLGLKDFPSDPRTAELSVIDHVTPNFPPTFISAGNGDPLLQHSVKMAEAVVRQGVSVDRLFFPANRSPALPHEYQLNLDTEAGRLALERTLKFLAAR